MPEFLRMRKLLRDDIIAELDRADDEERKRLQARINDLTAQINDPEGAFEAERKRLADLEDKLLREGNELGAERLNSAIAKLRAGNTDEAEAIFLEIAAREAMAVQGAARAEFGLGEIAESRVEWRAAAQHYARAAELDPSYDTLIKAGDLLWRAGQYEAAFEKNKRLVELSKQDFGARDPKTATALNNYAESLRAAGQYAEAEPLYREALEIGRETLGDRHPSLAIRLNNLAGLLRATGRLAEAEPLYREALEIRRDTLGDRHPDVASSLNNLAALLEDTGRYGEAEPLSREALEIGRDTLGDRHPDVAIWTNNLAFLLEATGRADAATPLFLQATAIFRAALGDDHPNTQTVARNTLIHLREHAPAHPDRAALDAVFGAAE
jgi:tetratricopeptide (TPR) repeat protein